ncbi:MAG TPA: alpha-1,4-glucan--maltose-1-phosphate maltosyltransferase [Casimicrobiaceae bacterium]|nr:alpha-1,4-glucan--maltose-1-phosphate maltosyltransferase [Casimicrobiaceae bacterium]
MRAVVENIAPAVDHGRFAIKRVAGDEVFVEADCYSDGHDQIACVLMWRRADDAANGRPGTTPHWEATPMKPLGNDRWRGEFTVGGPGSYRYTVAAWVDHFLSWRHDLARRVDPEDVFIAARVGSVLLREAAQRAEAGGTPAAEDRDALLQHAERLADAQSPEEIREIGLDDALLMLAQRHPDRRYQFVYPVEFPVTVDRLRARFSSWYEMFPRSSSEDGRHGTFRDCEARLPYVAQMGFDVLYLPPIHPIGRERRKGRNNTLLASSEDIGSPWAIGAAEGGHTAIHPALGTLADFRQLVAAAKSYGMEVALDIAFQTAPDHPYVAEHPQWFKRRPDGSVQYAENPPKKYQDIYPFDFESEDWRGLWQELRDVFRFWIEQGVHVFRVDNPHTKAFAFWEWAIADLKRDHPELIFLSEAFTRPKVMHRLAKLGFTQSYTYFTWRNTKWELTEYFTELSAGPGREYFRPNAWPNTPDILPEHLQFGGRPAFMQRLVLAATLSANYGIYGPAFELMEHDPREPGSEEYLHSEKYELKRWNVENPESLAAFIARVNRARHDNPALQSNDGLLFQSIDNDQLICYAKVDTEVEPDDPTRNVVIVAVNLDVHYRQSGWVDLDLHALGLDPSAPFQVHDLLTDARYLWHGARNYIELDPHRVPAHIFRVRRRGKSETDFDNFE